MSCEIEDNILYTKLYYHGAVFVFTGINHNKKAKEFLGGLKDKGKEIFFKQDTDEPTWFSMSGLEDETFAPNKPSGR
jgi:hypothetical protein